MSDLRDFVDARLAEDGLTGPVHRAYTGVLALSDRIRDDGETDDWVSWLTGASVALKVGEYVFGADPASDAARVSDSLRATLARTWSDHPDYDPAWDALAQGPER